MKQFYWKNDDNRSYSKRCIGRRQRGFNAGLCSWCLLLLIALLSNVKTLAFVPTITREPTTTTMTTTRTTKTTNDPICPSQPPDVSSTSALAMFGGSFNDDDDNNNNNNNRNSNEKKQGKEESWIGNFFGNILNFVWNQQDNFFGNQQQDEGIGGNGIRNQQQQQQQRPSLSQFFQPPGMQGSYDGNVMDDYYGDDEDDEEDELPAGTSLLFKIPAKQLKPGGLRLFLMFYLMGMQNTPDRNTWRADQRLMSVNASPKGFGGGGDAEEEEEKTYVLEMLYDVDRSGMLQIELLPARKDSRAEIRIYRCGSRPSTAYLMRESLIVDGLLDELQTISGEKKSTNNNNNNNNDNGPADGEEIIADEDRLLITDPPHAIGAARESLAFS